MTAVDHRARSVDHSGRPFRGPCRACTRRYRLVLPGSFFQLRSSPRHHRCSSRKRLLRRLHLLVRWLHFVLLVLSFGYLCHQVFDDIFVIQASCAPCGAARAFSTKLLSFCSYRAHARRPLP